MKKITVNSQLETRIVSGSLSVALLLVGYGLGKLDSKNDTSIAREDELAKEYLSAYVEERKALEKEIASLNAQKEKLQRDSTFEMSDLIVIENTNVNGETEIYILRHSCDDIYREYHNNFRAFYRLHSDNEEHESYICNQVVHFDEGQPLFNYLTNEEIARLSINGGEITTSELDEILIRLRNEYHEQKESNNHSKILK